MITPPPKNKTLYIIFYSKVEKKFMNPLKGTVKLTFWNNIENNSAKWTLNKKSKWQHIPSRIRFVASSAFLFKVRMVLGIRISKFLLTWNFSGLKLPLLIELKALFISSSEVSKFSSLHEETWDRGWELSTCDYDR